MSASTNHLSSGRINVSLLRDDARRRLLECINRRNGTKAIVWDEDLIGPFGLIAEYALLKDHNVTKMFHLHSMEQLLVTDIQNVIFLVRAKLPLMDLIADYLLKEDQLKRKPERELSIFFIPRKCCLCERRLEDLRVFGSFAHVGDYPVDLFPVDSDVLSLELPETFKECNIENIRTSMFHVARALMTLQVMFGVIQNVYGKGSQAQHVFDLMARLRREQSANEPQIVPQIDNLVLIDRSVDLLSPLATQLTYEGLLDHFFHIQNNKVKVPPEKFSTPDDSGTNESINEPKQIKLDSSDELFLDLRDKNFNAVGPILSKKAKHLSSQFEERHGARSVSEIKQFVGKLPFMQMAKKGLAIHTSIAELIKERTDNEDFLESLQVEQEFMNGIETDKIHPYIDDCIARQESILKVLRLVCMQSVVNNGLKPKVLDFYKREIIQTYGYQHIVTLSNLEKGGLLKTFQGVKSYSSIKKTLRLMVEDVNEQSPNDIAYVHSGYAPLSIRLTQFVTQPGWRAITDVLNLLPGPTVEEKQSIPSGLRRRRGSGSSIHSSLEEQRVTLVVFLGGCTLAEIAALRFLSQQDDAPMDYLIMTTSIINGETFLDSIFENMTIMN